MAGEVTMKDLQSLQGYVNKKIADLDAKLVKVVDATAKDVAALSKQIDLMKSLLKELSDQTSALAETVKRSQRP